MVIVLCVGFGIPKLYVRHLESSNRKQLTNSVPSSYVLAIGANLKSRGRYNSDSPKAIQERVLAKYGATATPDKYLPTSLEYVYEQWRDHFEEELNLAWEKISLVTRERFHYWVIGWYTHTDETGKSVSSASKQDSEYCRYLAPVYQILFSISALFCLFLLPVLSKSRQMVVYSVVLFLLSCLILQGVHEYQQRYSLIYFWGLSILGSAVGKQRVSQCDNIGLLNQTYNRFSVFVSKIVNRLTYQTKQSDFKGIGHSVSGFLSTLLKKVR